MRKCPKCGAYMMCDIVPVIGGDSRIIWSCYCGYDSNTDETIVTINRTEVTEFNG